MQYGGQTITLSHLAPFVRMSWNIHRKDAIEDAQEILGKEELSTEELKEAEKVAYKRLKRKLKILFRHSIIS